MKTEKKEFLQTYILLTIIAFVAAIIRMRHIELCDILDRGQFVLGMTLYHPPGYHWFTTPIRFLTENYYYSGAVTNVILCMLILVIIFKIGQHISGNRLGLFFAGAYAFFPIDILFSRYISNETMELLFYTAVMLIYMKIEIFDEENLLNKTLLFFTIVLGTFSKTQSFFFVGPLFLYGLYKHRLNIFKKDTYYIMALGLVPFFAFLVAHPELFAAIPTYFTEPAIEWQALLKLKQLIVGHYIIYMLPFALIGIAHLVAKVSGKIKYTPIEQKTNKFMIISFLFMNLLLLATQPKYAYILTVPMVYFSGVFLAKINWKTAATIMTATAIFVLATYFFVIPSYSILTLNRCEAASLIPEQSIIDGMAGTKHGANTQFFKENIDHINKILEGEKYIIIGGEAGQDFKINLKQRIYYSSVITSPKFKEINYAILVYPLDKTYRGAEHWDKDYLNWISENSQVVFEGSAAGRKTQLVHLTNHNFVKDENRDKEFIEKSRAALHIPYITT